MALEKPLDQIQEADLQSLIEDGTSELKSLEYKQALPAKSDSSRKEFLADVSSFANASGGHLIYGIKEIAGVASELCGLDEDGDATISALESSIREGISPRIPGVHAVPVRLSSSKIAVVLRISRSFIAPHMVTYKGTSRFYSRTSNGKFQLDVGQIRAAFLGSETTAERIREFRAQRVASILAGDTALPVWQRPKIVLHLVPLSSFDRETQIDLGMTKDPSNLVSLAPVFNTVAYTARMNIDGYLVYKQPAGETVAAAYTQLFRNGVIESVDSRFLSLGEPNRIPSSSFESDLIRDVRRFLIRLKGLGAEPPILIILTFLDVLGYYMSADNILSYSSQEQRSFDRKVLLPPEVLVESFAADVGKTLKPLFDAVWNASGHFASPYYRDGEWIGHQIK